VPDPAVRQVGLREVVGIAALLGALVLGLAAATSLLPVSLQSLVFRTPLAIGVLVVGTVGLLASLARGRGQGR
jgi:hypothetical protein